MIRYIKLFNGSDNEFLNFVFENFHVFFNLFDFFLFFQDLSNARKYRTVCSPDPKRKFKFRLYEFLRIYQQITFFFQATSNQGSTNANTTQNGHNGNQQNGDSIGIGTAHILEKEAIDIKDVELTLLPSYLHSEQESVNVIDNTDLLQSISKPNPQLSPPKRPPRSNHSPEGT